MSIKLVPTIYLEPRVLFLSHDEKLLDSAANVLCDVFSVDSCQTDQELLDYIANDKKIEDIVDSCYLDEEENDEPLSFQRMRMVLDYQDLAQKMYAYYKANEFVSVVCMSEKSSKKQTFDFLSKLQNFPISRVLIYDKLSAYDVIEGFENKLFQKTLQKSQQDINNELASAVVLEHNNVIHKMNTELFGRFCKNNCYNSLFSSEDFIEYFEKIICQKSIVFSCVYDPGGSLLMSDRNGQEYLLNIYSDLEIKNILFQSEKYERCISDFNKKLCQDFKLIVNYKNNKLDFLNDKNISLNLSSKITDNFFMLNVNNKNYYICLSKS